MLNSLKCRLVGFAGFWILSMCAFSQDSFWSETGGFGNPDGGVVYTAAFDGGGKKAIATGLNRPIGVALDVDAGHIYWAEDGVEPDTSRIVRANLDGSEQVILFNEAEDGFTNAQMIVLDLENGHVYWTDYFLGVIRGDLDGDGYTVLAGHDDAEQYTALALDSSNGHIYFGDPTQLGILFRMDLDGGNRVELARGLAEGDWWFNSIALDVPNGHIYYSDAWAHEIKRMDLNGGNQITLLNDPELNPYGIALRPDNRLYWVGGSGQRLGTAGIDGLSNVNLQLLQLDSVYAFGIAVMPASAAAGFRITEITLEDSTVNISWEGGTAPYQLLRSASLAAESWEEVGDPTTQTQGSDTMSGPMMFYRVQSAE